MWLMFALITFLAWGFSDLFYKIGNSEQERYSHLKTSIMVGIVMGATAIATLLIKNIDYDPVNLIIYLPVSLMYIVSMTIGYFGLKYLELSVSSPIQNASGAVSAVLLMVVLHRIPDKYTLIAIALITVGVVLLGIIEKKKETDYFAENNKKYKVGFVAFFMPLIYCVIDSLGTFFDGWYLDDISTTPLIGVTEETLEDVANISYQFTFLIVAIMLIIYVFFIKKERPTIVNYKPRLLAAFFESAGQLTYVYALSGNGIAAAPVISSYCVASLILSRIFIKEKLTAKQYGAVALVIIGIVIMGIIEGLMG